MINSKGKEVQSVNLTDVLMPILTVNHLNKYVKNALDYYRDSKNIELLLKFNLDISNFIFIEEIYSLEVLFLLLKYGYNVNKISNNFYLDFDLEKSNWCFSFICTLRDSSESFSIEKVLRLGNLEMLSLLYKTEFIRKLKLKN